MAPSVLLPGAVEEGIKKADKDYLEKHNVKALMHQLLTDIVKMQPKDPVQYLVDVLSFENPEDAQQDKHGLSAFRKKKLLQVFAQMDKNNSGSVDFKEVQAHTSRYGGGALTEEELKEIFKDFDQSGDNKISVEEFLQFFARAVASMDNNDFERMIGEMTD